jgi:hypothetical protein
MTTSIKYSNTYFSDITIKHSKPTLVTTSIKYSKLYFSDHLYWVQ